MRKVVALVVVAALCLYAWAISNFYPQEVTFKKPKLVPEERTASYTVMVPYTIDGQTDYRPEERTRTKTVYIPTWESVQRVPTWKEKAQWLLVVIAGGFYVVYGCFVSILWASDKVAMRKPNQHTKDNDARMSSVLAFAVGILTTFVAFAMKEEPHDELASLRQSTAELIEKVNELNATSDSISSGFEPNYPDSIPEPQPFPNNDNSSGFETLPYDPNGSEVAAPEVDRSELEPAPAAPDGPQTRGGLQVPILEAAPAPAIDADQPAAAASEEPKMVPLFAPIHNDSE